MARAVWNTIQGDSRSPGLHSELEFLGGLAQDVFFLPLYSYYFPYGTVNIMATSSLYCNFSSISQATVFRDLSGAEKRFAELIPSQTSKETSAALLQLCREAEVGCVFVTSPPADLICRQCRLVLRDPHQTQCCGGLYCGYCLRQQLDSSKQCPLCLSRQVRAFRDVSVTRRIDSLLVRCSNERHGCKWVGELGSLADHLKVCNKKPSVCRTCGKVFSNDLIREHETSECEKRKFQCPYCNEYNSTYQEVTEHHWPTCLFYPLFCPNECGKGYLPRKDVLKHLREECEVKKKLVELSTSIKALEAQLQERDAEIEELRMKVLATCIYTAIK